MPSKPKSVSALTLMPVKSAVTPKTKPTTIQTETTKTLKQTESTPYSKELVAKLKTKTLNAYNTFMKNNAKKSKIYKIYAGKTENEVPERFKGHSSKKGNKFNNARPYELVAFPEMQNCIKPTGQKIIGELEVYLIKLVKKDVMLNGFKSSNEIDYSAGGCHNKGDLQKLYLIIENK